MVHHRYDYGYGEDQEYSCNIYYGTLDGTMPSYKLKDNPEALIFTT